MWPSLLNILGKLPPASGNSFTSLSAMGTPGRFQSFSPKGQTAEFLSINYFLNLRFELDPIFIKLFKKR